MSIFFWQVKWQPVPDGKFREPTIDYSAAVSATTQEQQKSQCYCKKKKQIYLVLFSNEKIKCHLRFYRTFTIKLTIVPNQVLTL